MPANALMDWRTITDEREKYQAYLCSAEWGVLRAAVHERAGGVCERCKRAAIDAVHHLTYKRKYAELLTDLQGICNPCHEFTHGKSKIDPAEPIEIPTYYAGITFRSRLTAKWAAFFGLVGWEWKYRPTPFRGWQADFYVSFYCGHSECKSCHTLLVGVEPYDAIEQFNGHPCTTEWYGSHENLPFCSGAAFGNAPNVTFCEMVHGAGGGGCEPINFARGNHSDLWNSADRVIDLFQNVTPKKKESPPEPTRSINGFTSLGDEFRQLYENAGFLIKSKLRHVVAFREDPPDKWVFVVEELDEEWFDSKTIAEIRSLIFRFLGLEVDLVFESCRD